MKTSAARRSVLLLTAALLATRASAQTTGPATATAPATAPATYPAPKLSVDPLDFSSPQHDDLTSLSLEDLMNVEVTSVSKRKQRIGDAPAAITVISQEDIQRSGMTTIPDLLRMVPGMSVGKLDANKWSIGSRGFAGFFSNKLLVLMDGRSVYTPQFSGVLWNAQDYILDDLDRIEVIRGPGATIWGANAVNGVVNITTKSAQETQGWLFSGLGGTEQQNGAVRYGGKINDTYFRLYTKYSNYDDSKLASGADAFDEWKSLQGGFRIDRELTSQDTLTLQGDAYTQNMHQNDDFTNLTPPYQTFINDPARGDGGNLLGRYTHIFSDTSSFSVQTYYDRIDRHDQILDNHMDTGDIQFQHTFALGSFQQLIWGGGYRFQSTRITGSSQIVFNPVNRDLELLNGFIQDDFTLVPQRLHVFLGTKLEVNSFTDLEVEPTARIAWTPNSKNTVWAAVSRATRTPSRYEEDATLRFASFPGMDGGNALILGSASRAITSEKLMAYELGYRVEPTKTLSIDIAAFFNNYDHIINSESATPFFDPTPPAHLVLPLVIANSLTAQSYGGEIEATWRPTEAWKLVGSYSMLNAHARNSAGSQVPIPLPNGPVTPVHQLQLRSYFDITKDLQFNSVAYYVSSLSGGGEGPGSVRVDANILWKFQKNMDLMLGVQNLLDDRHAETALASFVTPTETERMFFLRLTCRF